MTALLRELAVIGAALLVIALAVDRLRDRGVLVPPPEMVVEQFVRDISLARWQAARGELAEPLAESMEPDSLRRYLERVERRFGRIQDVQGRPFFSTADAAEASAEIRSGGEDRGSLHYPLSRQQGLWKISRLDDGS
ncbi:MAG TPA: hypothetical protein VFR62_12405 [Gemmatimonadales bacterium]|nr:hypothetical protein [Gemmatimonadales bacterium]